MAAPTNGYVHGYDVSVGSSVTLGCDTGFTNLGHGCGKYPVKAQCQSNATHVFWTIDHLHCVGGTSTND